MTTAPPRLRGWTYGVVAAAIIVLAAATLLAMGRAPWCRCGIIRLWSGDAWGSENSQQFADPYTFTHVTHGVLLYLLIALLVPKWSLGARGLLAVAAESAWEILENTDLVINRYRAETLALGYYGDSVLNSVGDILACVVGFLLASRLSRRAMVITVLLLEMGLTLWVRDSLLLNVVMLIHPIDAVKSWQLRGASVP